MIEDKEGVKWEDLPDTWVCSVCDSPKSIFQRVKAPTGEVSAPTESATRPAEGLPADLATVSDLIC
jgi:hypothetical protein